MTMNDWKNNDTRPIDVEPDQIKYVDRPENTSASARATWALIFGIGSIICGILLGGAPWIGVLMGTAAIVLSAVEKKKKKDYDKKVTTAALACGIVGLCLSILVGVVLWFVVFFIKLSSPAWGSF